MRKFDTKVQHLKYKVLREVAREAWKGTLLDNVLDIPKTIIPGKIPTMRCCVYKERAILGERVKIAMGGNKENPNIIEVIDIACDECPALWQFLSRLIMAFIHYRRNFLKNTWFAKITIHRHQEDWKSGCILPDQRTLTEVRSQEESSSR